MKGVAYCRVSSQEQIEGTSLASQQAACVEYARVQGIELLQTFVEEGESAKFADRTKLLKLIEYCRANKGRVDVLLVWKVDRFARNVTDHFKVKATLDKYGVRIISVTEPIDAKPEGRLMETILAGFAQFDNDLRATRTVQGMRRKIQEGIFPWNPPVGYKTVNPKGSKKTRPDEPDEPRFSLLRRVWKEFLTGAHTKADIVRIMRSWGLETRNGKPLTPQAVDHIFANPFYAGVLVDRWTNEEHPGLHVPMVTVEEFAATQRIVKRRHQSKPHVRHREEFPLRGLVRCPACRWYLTASFSRGRSARYPYYHCHNRTCPRLQKTIAAAKVESEFVDCLAALTPTREVFERFEGVVLEMADKRDGTERDRTQARQDALGRVKRRLARLIDLRTQDLINEEEFRENRTSLLAQQHELESSVRTAGGTIDDLNLRCSEIRDSLCNLLPSWRSLTQRYRAGFQQIVFPVGYVYQEVRTAELGLTFQFLQQIQNGKSNGVPPAGICSNQMQRELQSLILVLREYHEAKDGSSGRFEHPAGSGKSNAEAG